MYTGHGQIQEFSIEGAQTLFKEEKQRRLGAHTVRRPVSTKNKGSTPLFLQNKGGTPL